jgi:preprotein translocase subunit SecG
MAWLIGFLTFVLILNCFLMILLVLVQLPKKEAGMGQAFGGAATDALFGAGSGNALTKMTKYAAAVFFVLTLSLSILNAQQSKAKRSQFERELQKAGKQAEVPVRTAPTLITNLTTGVVSQAVSTQAPGMLVKPTTNAAPAPTTNLSVPPVTEPPK